MRDALDRNGDTVKALWIESLANPEVSSVIFNHLPMQHMTMVYLNRGQYDATPYLCQPINYGADLAVRGVRALSHLLT